MRVLYSFPHKLGAGRICYTAWEQVNGLAAAGAEVLAFPGVLYRTLDDRVQVQPTLSRGRVRIPYKVLGTRRACILHDAIVARRLASLSGSVDIVHTWPLGGLQTLRMARQLGIPAVIERPNSHTAYAYEVVRAECERLDIQLPPGSEHAYDKLVLERELKEYEAAYRILCPSEFVVKTFRGRGFAAEKLARHIYGFDERLFYPPSKPRPMRDGITVLFVGFSAVRKGIHLALEAWLRSPAHKSGRFLVAGDIMPAYAEKIKSLLQHRSVELLGHRSDVPELMRLSDVLVLPSLEEGFGLVCVEAMGTGCVPLVSDACTDTCQHMRNALVHRAGDVAALSEHLTLVHRDRALLRRLREGCLSTAPTVTWKAAGERLLQVYEDILRSARTDIATSAHALCDAGSALR